MEFSFLFPHLFLSLVIITYQSGPGSFPKIHTQRGASVCRAQPSCLKRGPLPQHLALLQTLWRVLCGSGVHTRGRSWQNGAMIEETHTSSSLLSRPIEHKQNKLNTIWSCSKCTVQTPLSSEEPKHYYGFRGGPDFELQRSHDARDCVSQKQ